MTCSCNFVRSVRNGFLVPEMYVALNRFIPRRRRPFTTEPTKLQKTVMRAFGVGSDFAADLPEPADEPEIDSSADE